MSIKEKIFLARIAEQAERYDDMVHFIKEIIRDKNEDYNSEERNLLSVGFKNQITSKRTAIRTIANIKKNPRYQKYRSALNKFQLKLEQELYNQSIEIVNLIKNDCIDKASNDESRAFFYKIIGNYYRYVAESAKGDQLEIVTNGALESYEQAQHYAQNLDPCNPTLLGLGLSYSVFKYDVMGNIKEAVELAEETLKNALSNIDEVDESTFREAKSIIELLNDNLGLWKEEIETQ